MLNFASSSSGCDIGESSVTEASIGQPLNTAGLDALFARIARKSERVVFPVNEIAHDDDNPSLTFYCVHSLSGAGGTDFRHLARLMPAVRFYGIQAPPGRMRDIEFGASVEALADYYATALIRFQPTGPFLLGGWSAGAIIGLQIAQNLLARGREVDLVAAIDAAPENVAAGRKPWHPFYLLSVVGNLPGWMIHENLLRKGALRSMIRRAMSKARSSVEAKRAFRRGEKIADAHAVEGFMDLSYFPSDQKSFMKRLYNALLAYKPQNYLGHVVVYEAKVKPLFRLPQVAAIWRSLAPRSEIVPVKGTHLSILRDGHVNALAEDLEKRIARIGRRFQAGPHESEASGEI